MGYRPVRGARGASKKLRDELFFGRVHWIVEADIKGFFDHMDHDWLIRMLEERITAMYCHVEDARHPQPEGHRNNAVNVSIP